LPPNKVGRAATLCRQTKRHRLQVAIPACRHGDADLHKNRAVTVCRQTRLVGRQPFAAGQSVIACRLQTPTCRHGDADLHKNRAVTVCRQTKRHRLQVAIPACRHGDADLHKNRAVTLCRRTRPVGRQSFAADEGGKRLGNPCRIVSIGMPTYAAV